MDAGTAAQVL